MKTDRFSPTFIRVAAVLLAGLFLAAGRPVAGQITFRLGLPAVHEDSSKKLALALGVNVARVREWFGKNRSELRTVQGPGGKPAYVRAEVDGLIAQAGQNLDRAITQARKSGMEPLLAWSDEEIRRIQEELKALAGPTAAVLPGLRTPRAAAPAAVFARIGNAARLPQPMLAAARAAAPPQETVSTEAADRLLDEVGKVIGRLVFLAERNDLEVKLWVGSTPARHARFSFWPQGNIKGSAPKPLLIRTDGKRDRVLRGLYAYRAAATQGQVTELVQYPVRAGMPSPLQPSERLDLVTGSSFFCCRFDEQYCQHVDDEKECRP